MKLQQERRELLGVKLRNETKQEPLRRENMILEAEIQMLTQLYKFKVKPTVAASGDESAKDITFHNHSPTVPTGIIFGGFQ